MRTFVVLRLRRPREVPRAIEFLCPRAADDKSPIYTHFYPASALTPAVSANSHRNTQINFSVKKMTNIGNEIEPDGMMALYMELFRTQP